MNWAELREQAWAEITTLIAPALGTSLAVMLVVRFIGGRRVGSLATTLALAAAVFVAGAYVNNAISSQLPWRLSMDRPLQLGELVKVLQWSLEGKPPPPDTDAPADANAEEDAVPFPPTNNSRYWLVWMAGLAMISEFILPLLAVPAGLAWTVRTTIALLAGRLLTPSALRIEYPWVPWALGLVILLEWALLTSLARRWLDGVVTTGLGICCAAAGVVLLLARHTSASVYALLAGASLAGPAMLSWKWPSNTSPAAAACSVILPSLLLEAAYGYAEEAIPLRVFALAALAPLALLPIWLPFLSRREGWPRWLLGLGLPSIASISAAVWAIQCAKSIQQ